MRQVAGSSGRLAGWGFSSDFSFRSGSARIRCVGLMQMSVDILDYELFTTRLSGRVMRVRVSVSEMTHKDRIDWAERLKVGLGGILPF